MAAGVSGDKPGGIVNEPGDSDERDDEDSETKLAVLPPAFFVHTSSLVGRQY